MGAANRLALMTRCLTLVRPAGMHDSEAEAWMAVAVDETKDIPSDLLEAACAAARKTCDHHAKIIPFIFSHVEEQWKERREVYSQAKPKLRLIEHQEPPKPVRILSQADVDSMSSSMRNIGLKCGALVYDEDGWLVPAPEDV